MEPIARPLSSLSELREWTPAADHVARQRRVPLASQSRGDGPRILVCHDMRGGYLEDRFVQGCDACEAYKIVSWYLIDTFIYFSHHFVTIPTPGWIDAAHRNGTRILGTLITEWKEGAARCEEFLATPDAARQMAETLAEVMDVYQFDGWLVNIENEVKRVDHLLLFVCQLTALCRRKRPASQVLWYDSVTVDGKLDWQNQLNAKNAAFFDACDGIFLNYTWKEEHLRRSRDFCTSRADDVTDTSSDVIGGRRHDVYVGIDVFGRGCLGGGGMNCCEPLKLIKEYDLSVAVFAPGWTHENNESKFCHQTETKFWRQFDSFPHARRKMSSLPLVTSFCTGSGSKLFHNGEVASPSPWYNLSAQQLQPNIIPNPMKTDHLDNGNHGNSCVHYHDDGYHGGGCLKITGAGTFRFFTTDLDLDPYLDLHISYVMKPLEGSDPERLSLEMKGDFGSVDLKWMEENNSIQYKLNGWIQRSARQKMQLARPRLKEVSFKVSESNESCSYLIGHLSITNHAQVPTRVRNITVQKLSPQSAQTSNQTKVNFRVDWTVTQPAEHYSLLMQYMSRGIVVMNNDSDHDAVTSSSSSGSSSSGGSRPFPMTSSISRCDSMTSSDEHYVKSIRLLGHTRNESFLVTKLPEMDQEWETIKFIVVPYCGVKYYAAIMKSEFM